MSDQIKSGKEVIDEFFAEILNTEGVDKKTVEVLAALYKEGKLTDRNIQNALDKLQQVELDKGDEENDKN